MSPGKTFGVFHVRGIVRRGAAATASAVEPARNRADEQVALDQYQCTLSSISRLQPLLPASFFPRETDETLVSQLNYPHGHAPCDPIGSRSERYVTASDLPRFPGFCIDGLAGLPPDYGCRPYRNRDPFVQAVCKFTAAV